MFSILDALHQGAVITQREVVATTPLNDVRISDGVATLSRLEGCTVSEDTGRECHRAGI